MKIVGNSLLKPPINGFKKTSPTRDQYEGYTSITELYIARFLQRKSYSYYYEHEDEIFDIRNMHFDFKIEIPVCYNGNMRFKSLAIEVDGSHREDPNNPGCNIYGDPIRRSIWCDTFKDIWSLVNGILLIRVDDFNSRLHAISNIPKQNPILFEELISIFNWSNPIDILNVNKLKLKQKYLQHWVDHISERPKNVDKEEVRRYVNFIMKKYY